MEFINTLKDFFENILYKRKSILKNDNKIKIDTRPCKMPFERIEMYPDGIVYPCCPDFLKDRQSAGNIGEKDFEEIWNGKVFKDIRKKLKKGDFSFCGRQICHPVAGKRHTVAGHRKAGYHRPL